VINRYTEEARCAILFAQYEASQLRSPLVQTEHLLLGVLRENPALLKRLQISEACLRSLIHADTTKGTGIDLSNMPLSDESEAVFSFAQEEADRIGSEYVGIEHLLLGLLRDEGCTAARILRECGANIDRIGEQLAAAPHQPLSKEARMLRVTEGLNQILASAANQSFQSPEEASGLTSRFGNSAERARRAIFFARYEASQFQSPLVETEHLLLGIVREGIPRIDLFMPSAASKETLRIQIEEYTAVRRKVSVSPGLPFSEECERALTNAGEEAALLGSKQTDLEHLLLGLLREEGCYAARILRERGAELDRIRKALAVRPDQPPTDPAEPSHP